MGVFAQSQGALAWHTELGVETKAGWTPAKPPLKSSGMQTQHRAGAGSSNQVPNAPSQPTGAPRPMSEQCPRAKTPPRSAGMWPDAEVSPWQERFDSSGMLFYC